MLECSESLYELHRECIPRWHLKIEQKKKRTHKSKNHIGQSAFKISLLAWKLESNRLDQSRCQQPISPNCLAVEQILRCNSSGIYSYCCARQIYEFKITKSGRFSMPASAHTTFRCTSSARAAAASLSPFKIFTNRLAVFSWLSVNVNSTVSPNALENVAVSSP